jgi:hypothetical protein
MSEQEVLRWIATAPAHAIPAIHAGLLIRQRQLGVCRHGEPEGGWCQGCGVEDNDEYVVASDDESEAA